MSTRMLLTRGAAALLLTAVLSVTVALNHGARASAGMSPLDRLVAESEIREQMARFELYADGDGVQGRDFRQLADQLHAPEFTIGPRKMTRDEMVEESSAQVFDPTLISRHYLVSTSFDELTASTAKTRTTALFMRLTRNMLGADCKKAGEDACGGRVVHAAVWVYHDSWAKTAAGWQKTAARLEFN